MWKWMPRREAKSVGLVPIWIAATVLIGLAVFLLTVYVGTRTNVSDLEVGLLNFLFLLVGTGFSYYFGRRSAERGAREVVRPHAQKSIRRVLAIASGLQHFHSVTEGERNFYRQFSRDGTEPVALLHVEHTLSVIQSMVTRELQTASDAVEDWRDIAPEEVQQIERALAASKEAE